MSDGSTAREFHEQMDALFKALPPRDSQEYLTHLHIAPLEALPPQVLARAYREAAAKGWEEARRRTAERLFRRQGKRYDHLGPMIARLRRMVPPNQNWQDWHDLIQDAAAEILRVLPTKGGARAERAWSRFTILRGIDAWREHQGRRGEHIEPPREEPERREDGWSNPVEEALARESPDNELDPDVYELLADVIARIENPLARAVGEDHWLSGDPSPISGKSPSAGGKRPLVERLGASRGQLERARDVVLGRIIAELEHRGVPPERLDPYRPKSR